MREFIVRVNGEEFQVEVEEVLQGQKPAPISRSPIVSVAKPQESKPVATTTTTAKQAESSVIAPMPGTILAINFKVGEQVEAGADVVVLEAMKLENNLTAPISGTITAVKTTVGASVNANDILVEIG